MSSFADHRKRDKASKVFDKSCHNMQEIPCASYSSIWTLKLLGLKQSLQSIWCGMNNLLLFYSKFIFVSIFQFFPPQKHEFYYYTSTVDFTWHYTYFVFWRLLIDEDYKCCKYIVVTTPRHIKYPKPQMHTWLDSILLWFWTMQMYFFLYHTYCWLYWWFIQIIINKNKFHSYKNLKDNLFQNWLKNSS